MLNQNVFVGLKQLKKVKAKNVCKNCKIRKNSKFACFFAYNFFPEHCLSPFDVFRIIIQFCFFILHMDFVRKKCFGVILEFL
jgi:hypothetical protein